jgi:biopolymer transport protein ExbD
MSYSLFMFLPLPFKIITIVIGGVFFVGVENRVDVQNQKMQVEALEMVGAMPAQAEPRVAPVGVVIVVNVDGSFTVAGKKITEDQLHELLRAKVTMTPNQAVVIKAAKQTPHQKVISELELCQKAGVKNVSLAAKLAAP